MATEVKWIKIVTDIFDDEKIKLIESMPEADTIIVIWFKILCLAGKSNTFGVLLMNDRIPYNDEMLAHIFRRSLNTVRLAIATFEKYGMIEVINDTITIPNWGKHQQLDSIEKRREYQRKLMQKRRSEQKLIAQNNQMLASCDANGYANVSTPEGEEDKEEDIKEKQEKEKANSEDLFRIQTDHNEILDAAIAAGFPDNEATYNKLIGMYVDFGKEVVLDGISACVEQGKSILSYLRKCCQNIATEKGKPKETTTLNDRGLEDWDA